MNTIQNPALAPVSSLRPGDTFRANGTEYVLIKFNRTRAEAATLANLADIFTVNVTGRVLPIGKNPEALMTVLSAEAEKFAPTLHIGANVEIVGSSRESDNGMVGTIIRVNSKTYTVALGAEDDGHRGTIPFSMVAEITPEQFAARIQKDDADDIVEVVFDIEAVPPVEHTELCRELNHANLICYGECVTDPDGSGKDPAIARIDATREARKIAEEARGGVVREVTVTESYEDPELAYDVTLTVYGNGEHHIRIAFEAENTWMQAILSPADWSKLIHEGR